MIVNSSTVAGPDWIIKIYVSGWKLKKKTLKPNDKVCSRPVKTGGPEKQTNERNEMEKKETQGFK